MIIDDLIKIYDAKKQLYGLQAYRHISIDDLKKLLA